MSSFDWTFPYPSQRMPVLARNVVATSQPLAVQAGLRMLAQGGNAIDAALATAIALTVVQPTSNGIGSDAFAILWKSGRLYGFNGSGRSPASLSPEKFAGLDAMPYLGWDPVTVPGAVDAWVRLSERFGRLPFADLFSPAIEYASEGYAVSPIAARGWAVAAKKFEKFTAFAETFLPGGRAPLPGEQFSSPGHARTLEEIASTKGESFYRGDLARKIADHARETGGLLTEEDLAVHRGEWVEPISQEFAGHHLHEIPPNGQGLAALIALGILRRLGVERCEPDSADSLHLQIEALKIAFAEAHQHVADPEFMAAPATRFLDEDFLAERAGEIDIERAARPRSTVPVGKGTVYLTAADRDGTMISFIQSNYEGFGSGIVIPDTGIALQNRGFGFSLQPGHPNRAAGGKRPFHTIIPGFVTEDGAPVMSFGVMGGHMQAQGHVQMMVRIFGYRQNPQTASDAPRFFVRPDSTVSLEPGVPPETVSELERRGHTVRRDQPPGEFGGAQLIYNLGHTWCAASDHRKDGHAAGF